MFLLFFLILVLPKYIKIYSIRKQHPMHGSRFLFMICTVIRSPLHVITALLHAFATSLCNLSHYQKVSQKA